MKFTIQSLYYFIFLPLLFICCLINSNISIYLEEICDHLTDHNSTLWYITTKLRKITINAYT